MVYDLMSDCLILSQRQQSSNHFLRARCLYKNHTSASQSNEGFMNLHLIPSPFLS